MWIFSKVLVSRSTLDRLEGDYDVDMTSSSLESQRNIDTYYVREKHQPQVRVWRHTSVYRKFYFWKYHFF